MKIEKGQFLILTSGSYSDFLVQTLVQAKKDFDTKVVGKEFLISKFNANPYLTDCHHFLAWLATCKSGYVKEIDLEKFREVNIEEDFLD